jgi:DNA polymerase-3 subunit beta
MNETVIVPARIFPGVASFRAKQDIRYYLTGVCLDIGPDGAYIVATCGHVIAVAKIDDTPRTPAQFIIPADTCATLAKEKRSSIAIDCADLDGGANGRQIQIRTGSATYVCLEIDGKYPDWRRVAKIGTDEGKPVFYNPQYLAKIDDAARMIRNSKMPVSVRPGGTGCGFAMLDNDGAVGAWVMPMREDLEALPIKPAWTI